MTLHLMSCPRLPPAGSPRLSPFIAPPAGSSRELAVVVFSDTADLWPLRWLKRGFRHCFVLLPRGGAWVMIDPLAHYTHIELLPGSLAATPAQVAAAWQMQGCTALVTPVCQARPRLLPVRPYTCVEEVKRLLGLRKKGIFTPWQLYRSLSCAENTAML